MAINDSPETVPGNYLQSGIYILYGHSPKSPCILVYAFQMEEIDSLLRTVNHNKVLANIKKWLFVKMKTELPLFRCVLCSFCVDVSSQIRDKSVFIWTLPHGE